MQIETRKERSPATLDDTSLGRRLDLAAVAWGEVNDRYRFPIERPQV